MKKIGSWYFGLLIAIYQKPKDKFAMSTFARIKGNGLSFPLSQISHLLIKINDTINPHTDENDL